MDAQSNLPPAALRGARVPFDTPPFYLLEPAVRFWKVFPILAAILTFLVLIAVLWNDYTTLRILPAIVPPVVYFVSRFISRIQMKRFNREHAEAQRRSDREMVVVYQLLLDHQYREAREILESGAVMPSTARAWLMWLNRVYRDERERGGLKSPELAPPYERDKRLQRGIFAGVAAGFVGAMFYNQYYPVSLLTPVILFGTPLLVWTSIWAVRIIRSKHDRRNNVVWLVAYTGGALAFGTGILVTTMILMFFIPRPVLQTYETILGPIAAVIMLAAGSYSGYVTVNFIKFWLGYHGSRKKAK